MSPAGRGPSRTQHTESESVGFPAKQLHEDNVHGHRPGKYKKEENIKRENDVIDSLTQEVRQEHPQEAI